MRKILVMGAAIMAASTSYAAELVIEPIEKVYEIPNMAKAQIYTGVRSWFAESFKSAKDVIQMDDKEAGTIIGNGRTVYSCKGVGDCLLYSSSNLAFTLKVDIKDNKLRSTYSKVKLLMKSSMGETEGYIQKKQLENIMNQLSSLSDQMVEQVKANQSTNSNW